MKEFKLGIKVDPIKEVVKEVEDPVKEVVPYLASFSAIGNYNTINVKELMKDVGERQAYNLKKASGNFISADICVIGNKEDSDPTILINPSILDVMTKEELQAKVENITGTTIEAIGAVAAVKDAEVIVEGVKGEEKENVVSTLSVIGKFGAIDVIVLDKDLEQYAGLFKRITEDFLSADYCIIDPNPTIEPTVFLNPEILNTLTQEETQSRLEKLKQSITRAKK